MNTFNSFAVSFAACSFAVLFVNYLLPKGNVKNTAAVVLVLFCLVSIINPIKEIKGINIPYKDIEEENNFSDSTASVMKAKIRTLTDEALNEAGINNYELKLDISAVGDEIILNEFTVFIEDISQETIVKQLIEQKTGLEAEIRILEQV